MKAEACGCIEVFAVLEGVQAATFYLSVGNGEPGRTIYVDNIVLTCKCPIFSPCIWKCCETGLYGSKKKI